MRDEFSASEKHPDQKPPLHGAPAPKPATGSDAEPAREREQKPGRPYRSRRAKGGQGAGKDISVILKGWDYESGTINVRKVAGLDGSPKLQLRLDLGLLQMELTGRPDGQRPHGSESLLDYQESLLRDHQRRNGTDLAFSLSSEQCQSLRDEA